jgi:phosphatidylserine/phosphatidylglycerophosphate/cardiolipin synthase-like enzyme
MLTDELQTGEVGEASLRRSSAHRSTIFAPGRNCWRIARAGRAAVLVDGASYFTRLEAALRSAQRSILIVGWDFDGSIRLRPDVPAEESPPLGPLLRSLLEAQPDLEIRILVWSIAVVHAPGDPKPLLFGADWQNHPRLQVKLDTFHPIYAAHHQKIVSIDDCIAFVGGMDLTVRRWDTSEHLCRHPARLNADGKPCEPIHDIQMAVDGEAARAVSELVRARWEASGVAAPAASEPGPDLWPRDLDPDFRDVQVAIARTIPAWGGRPGVREAFHLTNDALMAARRVIYIETQYLTSPSVGDILAKRLEEPDGPDVVILMTRRSRGAAERAVMGKNRDRLIRRLRQADLHGRLKVFYPLVPGKDGERQQVLVHSKVIIVDDTFLRVGSSNLNNRSIGLDTECDLAIEAEHERTRAAIQAVRDRLVAEHLAATPEQVAEAIERHGGSLVQAIEELNGKPRGLRLFDAMTEPGPTKPTLITPLLDPTRPFAPFRNLRRKFNRAA